MKFIGTDKDLLQVGFEHFFTKYIYIVEESDLFYINLVVDEDYNIYFAINNHAGIINLKEHFNDTLEYYTLEDVNSLKFNITFVCEPLIKLATKGLIQLTDEPLMIPATDDLLEYNKSFKKHKYIKQLQNLLDTLEEYND